MSGFFPAVHFFAVLMSYIYSTGKEADAQQDQPAAEL
jgi:hypothetical protein